MQDNDIDFWESCLVKVIPFCSYQSPKHWLLFDQTTLSRISVEVQCVYFDVMFPHQLEMKVKLFTRLKREVSFLRLWFTENLLSAAASGITLCNSVSFIIHKERL